MTEKSIETKAYYTPPTHPDAESEVGKFTARALEGYGKLKIYEDAIEALQDCSDFLRADKLTGGNGDDDLFVKIQGILARHEAMGRKL